MDAAVVLVTQRVGQWDAVQDPAHGPLKSVEWGDDAWHLKHLGAHKGVAPGAINVADEGQGAAREHLTR
jgi:hypothetical protein